jgi:hypothetical protein
MFSVLSAILWVFGPLVPDSTSNKYRMHKIEELKALLQQDPSSYENWVALGETALEVALALKGELKREEADTYLTEVRLQHGWQCVS